MCLCHICCHLSHTSTHDAHMQLVRVNLLVSCQSSLKRRKGLRNLRHMMLHQIHSCPCFRHMITNCIISCKERKMWTDASPCLPLSLMQLTLASGVSCVGTSVITSEPLSSVFDGPCDQYSSISCDIVCCIGKSCDFVFMLFAGKDLSKISMPVSLNEPLSALQRLCEEMEYSYLLDSASACDNLFDRMVLVACFAVSSYANSYNRAGRKPFNPLLGETYEYVREDRGFKFIAEQVCVQP